MGFLTFEGSFFDARRAEGSFFDYGPPSAHLDVQFISICKSMNKFAFLPILTRFLTLALSITFEDVLTPTSAWDESQGALVWGYPRGGTIESPIFPILRFDYSRLSPSLTKYLLGEELELCLSFDENPPTCLILRDGLNISATALSRRPLHRGDAWLRTAHNASGVKHAVAEINFFVDVYWCVMYFDYSFDETDVVALPPLHGPTLCGSSTQDRDRIDRLPLSSWVLHEQDKYATHQPALVHYSRGTDGDLWELGVGFASTPLLRSIAHAHGRNLYSAESDGSWLALMMKQMPPTRNHKYLSVNNSSRESWEEFCRGLNLEPTYEAAVVFVDYAPGAARWVAIQYFSRRARYVICHDHPQGFWTPHLGLWAREQIYSSRMCADGPSTIVVTMRADCALAAEEDVEGLLPVSGFVSQAPSRSVKIEYVRD